MVSPFARLCAPIFVLSLLSAQQALKHEEERRFERLGSKLKAQRMEAEERKKEREVKLTDRVPPPKRPRTGGCKH